MRGYQKDFITLYDAFQNSENRLRKGEKFSYVLRKLGFIQTEGNCLDTGSSNGIITNNLSPFFKNVFGIDIDMTAMKLIDKSQNENTGYAVADAMELPFNKNSFEAIVCSQTYEHVPSSDRLFSEINRIIKPGGLIIFSGPNKTYPIEMHYNLPFLHWFKEKTADSYLRLTKKGDHYYERSRTYWDLTRLFTDYEIIDVVKYVLEFYAETTKKPLQRFMYRAASLLPIWVLKFASPFLVNINWILIKNKTYSNKRGNIKFAR